MLFTRTAREGTSAGFGRAQSHRLPCASLAASASVLSSVVAFLNGSPVGLNYPQKRRCVKAYNRRMNRNADFPALLLFAALLFGVVVRFYPAFANGFPLNDGGMFLVMARDLKANGYALPHVTTYNHADIPFAYPPFGLYAAALLSDLAPDSDLMVFLYLPALVNSLSIPVFYLLAKEILGSRLSAALAALIFALAPRSFLWQVMGGGVTRAFGMAFLLLMLWQAAKLFREHQRKSLFLTVLFGAGAILSHPQTALHAALGGALIFLFYGCNKRGFQSAVFAGAGAAALTSPWWWTVLTRHGAEPFLAAAQTSPRTIESYLNILTFDGLGDYLFLPTAFFALIGAADLLKKRAFFLPSWIALVYLADPRGGDGMALLGLSMLAGAGLLKLSGRLNRSGGEPAVVAFARRRVQILLLSVILYSVAVAGIFDFQLVNTSLKAEDLKLMDWVNANTENSVFLLATGREFSMSDPLQEWFPALTGQKSVTTMQGLEWALGENFFPWYEQLIAFQHCADADCVNAWAAQNNVEYDYLIVLIPDESDASVLAGSLRNLGGSVRSSGFHALLYESDRAMVFARKK